jgi:4-diphosphocytidyl-2-C-methyl-D-erythritol kinase
MIVPEIAEVLHRLETTDGVRLARMSGSGATCFALYDSRVAAEPVVASLRAARPGWWIAAGMLPWDPSPVF